MPYRDATFDRCISLLMLNFLPDYRAAATEMVRVTRIGGVVAAVVWDFAGGLLTHRMFYDTGAALDPEGAFAKVLLGPFSEGAS
jgi:ubiquinone/menaquinone biosynthesis C-methylase UbiE